MKYKTGEEFLNKLYKDMHTSEIVMHTATKSDTPDEKIKKYMTRLESTHNIEDDKHKLELLKHFYYEKYIIKKLPDSYIELQKKIAKERGYGEINVTEQMKEEMLKTVQDDQRKSLDNWLEYLTSKDAMYPMWFKNYAFEGMKRLGKYDKEKNEYTKRTKNTTEPYIELNRETLALVYDALNSVIGEKIPNENQRKALEQGESFKKLYTYYLTKQGYRD